VNISKSHGHGAHAHEAARPGLPKHEFLAGRIALDFCNSLSPTRRVSQRDRILMPADFAAWAARAGIAIDRAPSPQALVRLHRLRAALIGIFHARAEQRAPHEHDLALLNAELAEARAADRLMPTATGYAIEDVAPDPIDRLRHRIARDAGDLLTGDLRRVKRCPAHDCLWLFHDDSKNLSRRWCAMDDCGTKSKVRRHRAKATSDR
jgi:predicted RNA-binding Zn ribbon-like protein